MKILYVDLKYGYGIKSRGVNPIVLDGFKKSFERLGHDVSVFYYDDYLGDKPSLQVALCEIAESVNPDLIFFCLYQEQFSRSTLNYLKSRYTTINWFGDDQWRFENFTKDYAPCFTWCVTTDKFSIQKYHKIGQENVIYSQWAAINEHSIPLFEGKYLYDVTFIGAYHPYRKWFIEQLTKEGISVDTFGYGWPNNALSNEQMCNVFSTSKINLNISNSNSYDIRYLSTSLRALFTSLRSTKTSSQIKARNFEIPFFNGFQLTDYVPTLDDYFEIGREICCYSSPEEAVLLIKYYLDNNDERETIKIAGHKRSINEHGYVHRIENIISKIS